MGELFILDGVEHNAEIGDESILVYRGKTLVMKWSRATTIGIAHTAHGWMGNEGVTEFVTQDPPVEHIDKIGVVDQYFMGLENQNSSMDVKTLQVRPRT